MTQVGFYHLTTSTLDQVLPKLLGKILEAKKRAIVKVSSEEKRDFLNGYLWNTGRGSFLPHGTSQDGNAPDQPVWLTTDDENPNGAQFILLTEDLESPQLSDYERALDIFDGNNQESLQAARTRWKKYKDEGHEVVYWKQSASGSWEKG